MPGSEDFAVDVLGAVLHAAKVVGCVSVVAGSVRDVVEAACQVRVWRPSWPCPVGAILRQQRRGFGDPTYRIEGEGPGARHWRGIRTPSGPATLMIQALPRLGEVVAEAWGPGADWALGSVPALLGRRRRPERLRAAPPRARRAPPPPPPLAAGPQRPRVRGAGALDRRAEGDRQGGLRRLPHAGALPRRARARARAASRSCGCSRRAEVLRTIPSWEWLRLHVDPARSRTIVQAARVGDSLDRLTPADADAKLRTLPGVGRVDQRRGAPARLRRRRRRQLRRLPRRQGHRLGAARPPDRRRRAGRAAGGVAPAPRRGSRRTSRWPAWVPRGAVPGCRCRRTTRASWPDRLVRPARAAPPPTPAPPPAGSAGRPGTACRPPWRCRRRR